MLSNIVGGEYSVSPLTIDDVCDKNSYHRYYASGRTALYIIIDFIKKSCDRLPTVCVPDYVCKSVVDCLIDTKVNMSFYKVDESLMPSADIWSGIETADAVLVVNYFGLLDVDSLLSRIRKKNKRIRIIVDDVMNYFCAAQYTEYDYSFTSFRKWFPVPDGAEIRCVRAGEIPDRYLAENSFYKYKLAGNLLKNYRESIGDDICLELIKKGEELLDKNYMASCSSYTESIMESSDYTQIAYKRKVNAEILHDGLVSLGIKHIYKQDAVPLFLPVFLDQRDAIRRELFQNNIFCPVHWPSDWQSYFPDVSINPLYDMELSLICDHRYGEKEMKAQLEILKNGIRNCY